jgi:two-component system response regulator WspF
VKIGIANDDPDAAELLGRVASFEGHKVLWIAADGAEALRRCAAARPDLVLMDLDMPVMDGVESTRRIMAECPTGILIVTAGVEDKFSQVYEAMSHGALNAIDVPQLTDRSADALVKQLRNAERLLDTQGREITNTQSVRMASSGDASPPRLLVIGASTGGPQAVAEILACFPRDFPAAIVIVQHVDAQFVSGLASWLKDRTGFPVEMAVEGDRPRPGSAVLAGTKDHLVMTARGTLAYTATPRNSIYRPSIDVFFKSLEPRRTPRSIAVLLTGMGKDGAEGLKQLRQGNWVTIAQDEATSVVYGMPKAAARIGAATHILALPDIAPKIGELLGTAVSNGGR